MLKIKLNVIAGNQWCVFSIRVPRWIQSFCLLIVLHIYFECVQASLKIIFSMLSLFWNRSQKEIEMLHERYKSVCKILHAILNCEK